MGRRKHADTYSVTGIVDRLTPYETWEPEVSVEDAAEPELVERAARLLGMMPRNQRRETIELLLSPNNQERGRRAVDALIESAFAVEDERGYLCVA